MRSHTRKIISNSVILSGLFVLATCYTNCSNIKHGQGQQNSSSQALTGGGGGFDGKPVFRNIGVCPNGDVDAFSEIRAATDGSAAVLTKDNCQKFAVPVVLPPGSVKFLLNEQNVMTYQGKVFDRQTNSTHQRVTVQYCQGNLQGKAIEGAIWSSIEPLPLTPALFGWVTLSDGSSTGALRMTSTNGVDNKVNHFTSAGSQTSAMDLMIPSGALSYSISGGGVQTLISASCLNQPLPSATLHYAPNANFDGSGNYVPQSAGFNLADVSYVSQLAGLPSGTKALVYLGMCKGADAAFVNAVSPFIGHPEVFGFYLMDVPNPATCPAANLQAEADWIHANLPGAKTFVILNNSGNSSAPNFAGGYTAASTHIDLFGVHPSPCRSELGGCRLSMIGDYFNAALAAGFSKDSLIPVFQAKGGGTDVDDNGGSFLVPTTNDEQNILATWSALQPHPVFDYAHSWGVQSGNQALEILPALQTVFKSRNTTSW